MTEQEQKTFNANLNTLRHRVHILAKIKLPLEDLWPKIDEEFRRLANAMENEKGSSKSYRLLLVNFDTMKDGWVTVSAKDGFTIRLWMEKKAAFRSWVNLNSESKSHRPYTFTRNKPVKQHHEIVEEANKVLENR